MRTRRQQPADRTEGDGSTASVSGGVIVRPLHAVTGAFGYSGRYIAERLLAAGREVVTLTNSPGRESPLRDRVRAEPLAFDDEHRLVRALEGVEVLYNTYWVRFNDRHFTHAQAVANTLRLFAAAQRAGVRRVVHVSITNPCEGCGLEYFEGKARLERALVETGLPHSILRPAVLFGREDILINNIAWTLRRFPLFGLFGDGDYRLQPIFVDDLARLAVAEGRESGDRVIQAIGPETFTYRELVQQIARAIGVKRPLLAMPPALGFACGKLIGWVQRDRFITREEVLGLMGNYLYVDAPPAGTTRLTDWMKEHADCLGRVYASELGRRRDRARPYFS